MSVPSPNDELLIEKLLVHLKAEGYSHRTQQWYPARARQLLEYCNTNALEIEVVCSVHITRFLRQHYRLFHKLHGNVSTPFQKWWHRYTGAINMLLRLVHGRRPIPDPPSTALEAFTEISYTTTMYGCVICVDCGRRRGPSVLRMHCGYWVGSDHVQTRKASPTSRFPISMRT